MNALKISDTHEWRFDGRRWWLHYLPSGDPAPLRPAGRFEAEMLDAAKREIEAAHGVREAVIVQCPGCGEGVAEGMACRRKRGATRPPDCKASPPRDGDPDTYGVEGRTK